MSGHFLKGGDSPVTVSLETLQTTLVTARPIRADARLVVAHTNLDGSQTQTIEVQAASEQAGPFRTISGGSLVVAPGVTAPPTMFDLRVPWYRVVGTASGAGASPGRFYAQVFLEQ